MAVRELRIGEKRFWKTCENSSGGKRSVEALGKVVLKENTQVWRNAEEIVVKIKSVEKFP